MHSAGASWHSGRCFVFLCAQQLRLQTRLPAAGRDPACPVRTYSWALNAASGYSCRTRDMAQGQLQPGMAFLHIYICMLAQASYTCLGSLLHIALQCLLVCSWNFRRGLFCNMWNRQPVCQSSALLAHSRLAIECCVT